VKLPVSTQRWSIRVCLVNAARGGTKEVSPLKGVLSDAYLGRGFAEAGREGYADFFGTEIRVTRSGAKDVACVVEISRANGLNLDFALLWVKPPGLSRNDNRGRIGRLRARRASLLAAKNHWSSTRQGC
jgi:hypothetical protein